MRHHDPATCSDDCPACQDLAEARAEDIEPDFDESAAADQYERSLGW